MKKQQGIAYKISLVNKFDEKICIYIESCEYQNITEKNIVLKNRAGLLSKSLLDEIIYYPKSDDYIGYYIGNKIDLHSLLNINIVVYTINESNIELLKKKLISEYTQLMDLLINNYKKKINDIEITKESTTGFCWSLKAIEKNRLGYNSKPI